MLPFCLLAFLSFCPLSFCLLSFCLFVFCPFVFCPFVSKGRYGDARPAKTFPPSTPRTLFFIEYYSTLWLIIRWRHGTMFPHCARKMFPTHCAREAGNLVIKERATDHAYHHTQNLIFWEVDIFTHLKPKQNICRSTFYSCHLILMH